MTIGPTIIETKPTISFCKRIGKNPDVSTKVSIWILKRLYSKYGNWRDSLMGYNAGSGRIDNYLKGKGKPLTFETLNYYTQLLAIQEYMKEVK